MELTISAGLSTSIKAKVYGKKDALTSQGILCFNGLPLALMSEATTPPTRPLTVFAIAGLLTAVGGGQQQFDRWRDQERSSWGIWRFSHPGSVEPESKGNQSIRAR